MENFGLTKVTFDPRGFIDVYNGVCGGVVAVLSAIFGEYWFLFAVFALFNVLDWASGWYKSRRLQQESSGVGLRGIVKKLWYWVLVAVAFAISWALVAVSDDLFGVQLGFLSLIGWFTLACLLVNEARSICENLVEAGVKVPAILVKGLAVADKLIKNKAEGQMPSVEDNAAGDETPPAEGGS